MGLFSWLARLFGGKKEEVGKVGTGSVKSTRKEKREERNIEKANEAVKEIKKLLEDAYQSIIRDPKHKNTAQKYYYKALALFKIHLKYIGPKDRDRINAQKQDYQRSLKEAEEKD